MPQQRILLLGRKGIVVDDAKAKLNNPNLEIYGGTGINDVRTVFSSHADITHVFMGGGDRHRDAAGDHSGGLPCEYFVLGGLNVILDRVYFA